ncbi:glycosyltransferase family 4 protein [Corynebacterium pelargi]|uniref:Mannosylfructose-phosphate synthase n=1 Tax=Corynebacterium pelargi TaxID=1471400 RepID=A0A410W5U0_9CORY|nr:glycosyltransferase family 4 protein [Corynebacterium pelargi]QAU51399.1 Mannosylfructose-phosphate synthase [Corynebacterium pelargi]GGG81200.1 glycosyl transferase [Corynebacterium pelargi]
MKLHVITSLWPSRANPISGIFVAEHVSALRDQGHEVWVTVVSPKKSEWLEIDGVTPHYVRTLHLPVRFHRLHRPINTKLAARVAKWTLPKPDVDALIVHNQVPLGFCVPWWQSKTLPTAVIVHGDNPPLNDPDNAAWMRQHLPSIPEHVKVLPVGKTVVPFLDNLGVRHHAVLGNGTKYAEKAPGSNTPKQVVSIANMHKGKALDVLIDAFGLLDASWRLRIVGDGPERRALEEQVAALGIGERVEFLGRLDREATLAVLDGADLFALASTREPFGVVYLEAAMRGIPPVGCFGTGAEEIISDGVTGRLVPKRDPEALAAALEDMWGKRDALGDAAREDALGRTWHHYNEQLLAILGFSS